MNKINTEGKLTKNNLIGMIKHINKGVIWKLN